MNFKEKQEKAQIKAIEDYVIEFIEKYEPVFEASAEKGFGGYVVNIQDEEKPSVMRNVLFLEALRLYFSGCNIRIKEDETKNLFFSQITHRTEKLVIEWGK